MKNYPKFEEKIQQKRCKFCGRRVITNRDFIQRIIRAKGKLFDTFLDEVLHQKCGERYGIFVENVDLTLFQKEHKLQLNIL